MRGGASPDESRREPVESNSTLMDRSSRSQVLDELGQLNSKAFNAVDYDTGINLEEGRQAGRKEARRVCPSV